MWGVAELSVWRAYLPQGGRLQTGAYIDWSSQFLEYVNSATIVYSAKLAEGGWCTPYSFHSIYYLDSSEYPVLSTHSLAKLPRESYLYYPLSILSSR